MSTVTDKVQSFKNGKFNESKDLYEGLASSQSPHTLVVTCSDSRLCPHEFLESQAGELFVVRNAGNLIPQPDAQNPSNEALTIEYGVVALGVKELLVCGHKSCGAMGGLMKTSSLEKLPLVQKGLENYKEQHAAEISQVENVDELIFWNVKQQLKTLMSYDFVKERVLNGSLKLTGVVYDFVHAEIIDQACVDQNGEIR